MKTYEVLVEFSDRIPLRVEIKLDFELKEDDVIKYISKTLVFSGYKNMMSYKLTELLKL